jgi:hypothetical protein
MNRAVQTIALITCAALLFGILLVLVGIGRNGIRIELSGDVNVTGMHDTVRLTMPDSVSLVMEEPAHLLATGAEGQPIPATISLLPCAECGASMVPTRWNPWSGVIEWSCPVCGETAPAPESE